MIWCVSFAAHDFHLTSLNDTLPWHWVHPPIALQVPMLDPSTQEWGGPTKGGVMPEPTRFGDWERKGRCTDFS